jgi:precorrin-2 dehydrogenase/sirohydrochlorin ferrochelatase
MLIDLNLADKRVLIVGGGEVAERKVEKMVGECPNIIAVSKAFTDGFKRLQDIKNVELITIKKNDDSELLGRLISSIDVVIVATDDLIVNKNIAGLVRRGSALVSLVDNPSQSDFFFPAVTSIGEIQVAINTRGKSPAMAKILIERIKKVITEEDLLQVQLQHYARNLAKLKISDVNVRKNILYKIIQDEKVKQLLKKGFFDEAKIYAKKIIERV